jgi:hypothetical protein
MIKIQALSGDLLLKLAVAAAAVYGVYYLSKKASSAAGDAIGAVGTAIAHPFPNFDNWVQGKVDGWMGVNQNPVPTNPPLPIEFGIIDPNAPW